MSRISEGAGLAAVIVKMAAIVKPPAGSGLKTVTCAVGPNATVRDVAEVEQGAG